MIGRGPLLLPSSLGLRAGHCWYLGPPLGRHWLFQETYEGYTLDDCDPLGFDHTDAVVTWKGKSHLSPLMGKPVYVRFDLRRMGLYSFRIAKE